MKIYCNAECEYNKGHCTHPENLDMGCYGGIDRAYVDKCALFRAKDGDGTRMTKCEKCIHGDICANRDCMDADDEIAMTYCAYFIGKADLVEVVRCKDCIYHNVAPCPMRLSLNWTNDTDFCSYGERKKY